MHHRSTEIRCSIFSKELPSDPTPARICKAEHGIFFVGCPAQRQRPSGISSSRQRMTMTQTVSRPVTIAHGQQINLARPGSRPLCKFVHSQQATHLQTRHQRFFPKSRTHPRATGQHCNFQPWPAPFEPPAMPDPDEAAPTSAVRHQLSTAAGVQEPASAHIRQRLPLSSEPAAPDSSLRPPCPDLAVLFPLPRARQPAPLSQINPRSSIHGDQSTITWHAYVCTPSARASVLTTDSNRQPNVHIRFF
ncbi:hypothetical protein ACLOJK_019001, partial [Asimina triloba]